MGLLAKRCNMLGARAACWKSLGDGRMLILWKCPRVKMNGVLFSPQGVQDDDFWDSLGGVL